jgi:hypothetical protein
MTHLVLNSLMAFARYRKAVFMSKIRQVEAVQERFLKDLLKAHRATELGQTYGLGDIRTIDQFRAQVPILPYSSYESYTDRIAQGESNLMTADPVVYLTLTSGSTGKKKLIPTTRRSQNGFRVASMTSIGFLADALRSHSRQFHRPLDFGKLLVTNSTQVWGTTSAGIEYGPSSAGVLRMEKRLYQHLFTHPYETLQVSDSLARHYLCLLFALRDTSLRGMIANFPMLILRTCNYLETYAEALIEDLAKGTIAPWLELDPALRQQLEAQWVALPERAAQLRACWQSEGRLTPQLAWPTLAYVATARGGTSDFYFERFPDYFGDTPGWGAAYASAEGMFSIYHSVNDDSSILAVESGFYEFIPQDQWEVEQPKTLLPCEVKVGQQYRILITNYGGFYRYDIGDVVEVVGFYHQAPLLVFRYRRGGFISSTTEKTTEFHVTQVMQTLQQSFGVPLEDFCVTLSAQEFPARYLVNVELAPGRQLPDAQHFLDDFDRHLQSANTHYAISRRDPIPPPRLRILAPGSFAEVRQRQLQRGMPDSQLKFPHISEDRHFLDGLQVQQEVHLGSD